MDNVLIYSPLLLHKMHLSVEKKEKGERELHFRLKQSTISGVQKVIWVNSTRGAALDG